MMKCFMWFALLMLLMRTNPVAAESDRDRWFSFTWDNDLFVGSDGGYTNGIYLSWYDASGSANNLQQSVPWYYRLQTGLVGTGKIVNSVRTHSVGQTMATPSDIERVPPDENDTPYAGLLFWQGSIAVNRGQRTDYSTLYLGVVGPASLTEQSQKIVHKATGSTVPQGWDYQLKNEPLVALHYGRLWQNYRTELGSLEFDVVTGMQGGLGNVRSSVDASAFFRVGSQLNTSYSVLALASQREINPTAHSGGWFVYVGTSIQYAFNNIILDGNTFRDSPSVSWKHGAGTISLGAAMSTKNWGYSISYTDFAVSEPDDIGKHAFGSISVLHRLQ